VTPGRRQPVATDVVTEQEHECPLPSAAGSQAFFTTPGSRRVLLVAPQPFYQDRGTPIAVRQVVEGLGQLGYRVDLLTYPVGADIEAPGLRLIRTANPFGIKNVPVGLSVQKILLDIPLTLALQRQLSRGGYTCVHAVEEAAFPAVLLGRRYRVPVIYDMQSSLPEQLVTRVGFRSLPMRVLANRLEQWLLAKADFVVSSAGLESRVHRVAPEARVREWHYPSVMVRATEADGDALRRRLAIPPDVPVVLYGGTFEAYQGLTELIQAIPMVRAAIPGATFVLVGAENGSGAAIRAQAASLLQTGVLRIIDRQPRHEISSYFSMADVLVSPRSHGGNLPLKVFDYLAAGRPIVATDIPTHRTVLNQQCAVLVPPHSRGLAEGILSLLGDPERAAGLGHAARAYAEERLGWSSFVASLGQLYEEVHRHAPVLRS
jgi:glycosyltransferase involved in cell wall biosynthesis